MGVNPGEFIYIELRFQTLLHQQSCKYRHVSQWNRIDSLETDQCTRTFDLWQRRKGSVLTSDTEKTGYS